MIKCRVDIYIYIIIYIYIYIYIYVVDTQGLLYLSSSKTLANLKSAGQTINMVSEVGLY